MKKVSYVLVSLLFGCAASVAAQEASGVSFSAGADVVSAYVFRGKFQETFPGANVQPTVKMSAGGFSLGAWGSTSLSAGYKEVDLTVGYDIAGASLRITDYWIVASGGDYFKFGKNVTSHAFEATVGYTLPEAFPLSIAWNTVFAGKDELNSDGDKALSTYVGLTYPFAVKGVDLEAELGFTPWEGAYSNNFNVVNVSLKAAKAIAVTNAFALPIFVQYLINPYEEDANLVFGVNLSF
ncbi:hypothetical protein AGMMS49965_15210 [Bacteroidia bacterium]|nr:hypothetical protein AGMMS49965_15210 [Bacteroidia bacterium]